MIKTLSKALLPLSIGSCSFIIPLLNAEPCPEGFAPSCDGATIVTCEADFIQREDCGALSCNEATLFCEGCGDSIIQAPEQCDDGNQTPGDGCENDCTNTSVPSCGDGTTQAGETCDDGGNISNDGCSDLCQIEADVFVSCGSAAAGNGSLASPFNSLAAAVTAASTNDVVMILPQSPADCAGSGEITKTLIIQGLADPDAPNVPARPTINGGGAAAVEPKAENGQVIIRDLFLRSDRNGTTVLQFQTTSRLALLRVDITNPNAGTQTAGIRCNANSQAGDDGLFLMDQSIVHDIGTGAGLTGFVAGENCRAIIANSLFFGNQNGAIRVDGITGNGGDVNVIHSTFSENGPNLVHPVYTCSAEPGVRNFDSCIVDITNTNDPIDPTDCDAFNFNDVFGPPLAGNGNINQNPLFTVINGQPFHLGNGSPARGAANPAEITLLFDPVAIFGVDVYAHDFNGTPRPTSGRDMGMFEDQP